MSDTATPENTTPDDGAIDDDGWLPACTEEDVPPGGGACVLVGDRQIAIFRFSRRSDDSGTRTTEWYATQNRCPHWGEMVLWRGLLGDADGEPKVACPMHKKTFALRSGSCLTGGVDDLVTVPVRVAEGTVFLSGVESIDRPTAVETAA